MKNHSTFNGVVSNLWGAADKYNKHEVWQNSSNITPSKKKVSTVTPVGRRGHRPVGKR